MATQIIGVSLFQYVTLWGVLSLLLMVILIIFFAFGEVLFPFIKAKLRRKGGKHILIMITKNGFGRFKTGDYCAGTLDVKNPGIFFINRALRGPCGINMSIAAEDSALSLGPEQLKAYTVLKKNNMQGWDDVVTFMSAIEKRINVINEAEGLTAEERKKKIEDIIKEYDSDIVTAATDLGRFYASYANPAAFKASKEEMRAELIKDLQDNFGNAMKWIVAIGIFVILVGVGFYILKAGGNAGGAASVIPDAMQQAAAKVVTPGAGLS